MGRKRRIWGTVLTCMIWMSVSCSTDMTEDETAAMTIRISCAEAATRAFDPDEDLIDGVDVMIFDEEGRLDERMYLDGNSMDSDGEITGRVTLLKNKKYFLYACANLGSVPKVDSIRDMEEIRCHLAYPDEYRSGIPMAGKTEFTVTEDEGNDITIPLERMMSKISIRMDRGGLSEGISMNVVNVMIGNCPKTATMFKASSVRSQDECFTLGFNRNESECSALNTETCNGASGTLSLYMLENIQGELEGVTADKDKVFPEHDIRRKTCSYIEIWMDYSSPDQCSRDTPLKYRFYLGESCSNLDVERNCHYRITVLPEDDGLSGDGWRVDKSGLVMPEGGVFFRMEPSGYIQGDIGDRIHIRCDFRPSDAPFEIGLEELEFDKERGIYDYETDPDGHGVTLTLKAPGRGIVYMSAGAPINESGMLVIEVNDIKNNIS